MKRFIFATIAASATIFFAAGCQEKNEMAPTETSDRNVITASIPEAITRVSMNAPADGKGLALAWEAGDELTVIGVNSTEQFTIADGFTAHNAQFNGTAVDGDSFTVIYPGQTYKTLDEINAVSYLEQKQTGNGNTDHLFYHAMVETSDYTSLDFSKAKQNGVIKFLFQLPSEATVVESVTLSATDAIFYATNNLDGEKTNSLTLDLEDVDVSASEQMLTAYMMISWNDVTLQAASKLTITVNMPDSKFEQVLTVPETGLTILSGKVNTFGLNDKSWTEPLFFGGNGTEADPYQIKSYTHLDNVRNVINAETKTWFVMVDDIDMAGKNWTMYNNSVNNTYKYDFDGNDRTIANFTYTGTSGASFFGAITGGSKVYDLKFNKVVLSDEEGGSNSVGTVSYNIIDGTVDNVDITDATITSATGNSNSTGTGAIASRLYTGSISNCDVENLTMNTTAERVGGIVGVNATNGNTIENCTVTNATISGAKNIGGIVGRSSSTPAVKITNCRVLGNNTLTSTSTYVGGILGENGGAADVNNCIVNANISSSYSGSTCFLGGIVGYAKGTATISRCSSYGNLTASNGRSIGGVLGGSDQNTSTSVTECAYLGGEINGLGRAGGIVGFIEYAVTVTNCYSAGTTRNATWSGGIVGWHKGSSSTKGNITNCYSSMTITTWGDGIGGIVGCYDSGSTTRSDNNIGTISGCIAWNTKLSSTSAYSGCITGGAGKASSVSDCYRNPAMETGFASSDPTDITSTSEHSGKPYHGKAAGEGETVSSIAQTKLGWSGDIWDFTTALPTLKNLPK